jgi:probable HAF family extracellular repeat protein
MKRYAVAVVVTLLVVLHGSAGLRANTVSYTVENLGTTTDGFVPTITGMNSAGQISGYVDVGGSLRAVRYTNGLGWQYLPGLEGTYSLATGINASGALSGYEYNGVTFLAFRFDGGSATVLGMLNGGSMSVGLGINDAGDVVGYGNSSTGQHAWKSAAGTNTVVALPGLPGGSSPKACGINASGWVVGAAGTSGGALHAYRISPNGVTEDLGSLDGATGSSAACAIDEFGRVGGDSSFGGATHAFRYDSGPMVDLDTFGSPWSTTNAVANSVSVGSFTINPGTGDTHAFVQSGTDPTLDLNDQLVPNTGWVLVEALAVNSTGQIAGDGYVNGTFGVFRATPSASDTTAPLISGVTATPSTVSMVNGQLVNVAVDFMATDDSGQIPTCQLSASGPGVEGVDFAVTGPHSGNVKAVGGRTYTFTVRCSDAAGNSSSSPATVAVQTDMTAPVINSMTASPSPIWPPKGQTVGVAVNVGATDDSGVVSCKLTGITVNGAATPDAQVTGDFTGNVKAVGGRTYTFVAQCADFSGNTSSKSVDVLVTPDTTAPMITSFTVSPDAIWPPNGKMVPVSVMVTATDNVDPSPSCTLTSVSGGAPGSSVVTGQFSANVRSDNGAVYTLTVTCSDFSGNTSSASTSVVVAKTNGNGGAPKANGNATTNHREL